MKHRFPTRLYKFDAGTIIPQINFKPYLDMYMDSEGSEEYGSRMAYFHAILYYDYVVNNYSR